MQLQFDKQGVPCLHTVKREIQTQEQTQELRISDGMPDIGSVIGAWGQVILRGKEWQNGAMTVNGGTMVWVQYTPEEGGLPQCIECWIPFQMTWPLPQTQHDGVILAQCLLRSVDARSTSARKMMVRTNVSVLAHAMEEREEDLFAPGNIPVDIQLRTRTYPVELPMKAGEKAFTIEETLHLPPSAPKMEKQLSYQLLPEIMETKMVNDKLVFRGNGILHVLYLAEDGGEHTWDFELPFAQYCELESEYGEQTQILMIPCVTTLELDRDEDQLQVRAGLVCQYRLANRHMVEVVTDAYSNQREITPVSQDLHLPGILESKTQNIQIQQNMSLDAMRIADVRFQPGMIMTHDAADETLMDIPGYFQILYYDMDGELRSTTQKWEQNQTMSTAGGTKLHALCFSSGNAQGNMMSGNCQLTSELELITNCVNGQPISMITSLEAGDMKKPDPNRPSLILRRADSCDLWELAKCSGSTEAAIREANGLQAEPALGQMLLIPLQ